MTAERASEIERKVRDKHIEAIRLLLRDCENLSVVFNIGRVIGIMQHDLSKELKKEVLPDVNS